ncbi:MAG TPA: SDR family oxidoreductase [Pirellulales bacterium]|nr:SDR family oxidoreductase [Pirellulales bacterium]
MAKADVSQREDVEAMMEFVTNEFGRLDVVVSNAASGGFRPLSANSDGHFDAAMHTNARALMILVQSALPLLRRQEGRAKVIAISSHGSHRALPLYGSIGASKAALEALIRQFALELSNEGINFNTVLAGVVETDSTRRLPGAEQIFDAARHRMMVGGRPLLPNDVAAVVSVLAGPGADMVQGATVVVDGGEGIGP